MKLRLMVGTLGVVTLMCGQVGLMDAAHAASRGDMDSASPVSVLSAEDINKMVDQRVDEQLKQILGPGEKPPPPSSDLFETPQMGQTSQSGIRGVQQRKIEGVDWVTGGSVLQGGRTIYAKPFVRSPKTIVGGYIDFTITDCNGATRDCARGLEFDQERFVPFFYSQVTDRLSVGAEVEVEHGGPQGNQGDGDLKIEFATMDYRFTDWLNFRGGIILIPLGRFNLIHDSPLNDLPLRPMVSRLIIPSTFAESGLGLFGTFYPTALSKVDYEFYITQGFDGGTGNAITEGSGLRSSRGSFKDDNNENKAIVSRVSVSPILGIEVAGSVHHSYYDDASNNALTIVAVDGLLQRGPFEIQGEAAWAHVGGGSSTPSAGVPPKRMDGYYVQGNYHFMPEFLKRLAPTHFSDASTFTAIVRWGQVDTNTQSSSNANEIDRLTFGVNFRPVEDAVFKFAYTFNDHNGSGVGSPSDPGAANGWQFSMSTYF